PGILARNHVYLRRGASVGIATWPEVEALIRAKGARLDTSLATEPIQAGFVELESASIGGIVARVTNISAEPVTGVDILLDATMPALPGAFYSAFKYAGARLEPGTALEATRSPLPDDFVLRASLQGLYWRGKARTRILRV